MWDQPKDIIVLDVLQGWGPLTPCALSSERPPAPGLHHPQHTNISSPKLAPGPQPPAMIFGGLHPIPPVLPDEYLRGADPCTMGTGSTPPVRGHAAAVTVPRSHTPLVPLTKPYLAGLPAPLPLLLPPPRPPCPLGSHLEAVSPAGQLMGPNAPTPPGSTANTLMRADGLLRPSLPKHINAGESPLCRQRAARGQQGLPISAGST